MSKELQQIGHGRSRSICVSAAKIREPGLNTGELDTNGVEIVVKDQLGTPHYFPSEEKLLVSATGRSGISFLGVDNTSLVSISGGDGQKIIESIDDVLVDIRSDVLSISGATPSGVVLANGSVPYTANQSMGGYSITNAYGVLSSASLTFAIDEDNNDSNNNFIWRNNGSLELMRLNDSGILGIGTNSPDVSAKLDVNGMIKGNSLLLPHGDTPSSFINGLMWTDTYGVYSRIDGVTKRLNVLTLSDVSSESSNTSDQTFSIKSGTEFRIQDNISETPRILFKVSESLISLSEDVNINGDLTVGGGSVSISSNNDLNLISSVADIYLKALEPSSYIYIQASESIVIDGKLELDASTLSKAPLNIPQGINPSSFVNGDTWTTSAGSYQRINGSTRKLDVMSLYDVSSQSNNTSAQTFTIKDATSFFIKDSFSNNRLEIVDGTSLYLGAPDNAMSLEGNSLNMTFDGYITLSGNSGGINMGSPTYFSSSTTDLPSIRIPHGVAPASPSNGDMWTTSSGLFVHINNVTKTVTLT